MIAQGKLISNMQEQQRLTENNLWHSEERNELAMNRLSVLTAENNKLQRRFRTWRTVAFIGGAIVLAAGGTGYLILK